MTTYTAITNGQVDADSPVDAPLMQALRDNPLSIQEMAATAPPILGVWHPYDMVTIGDGSDGAFWDFASDGVSTSNVTPDMDDGFEYMFFFNAVTCAAGNVNWQIEVYQDVAASYTTATTFNGLAPAAANTFAMRMANARWLPGGSVDFVNMPEFGKHSTGTVSDLAIGLTSGNKAEKLRFTVGANWNGGSMHMFRRKVLIHV